MRRWKSTKKGGNCRSSERHRPALLPGGEGFEAQRRVRAKRDLNRDLRNQTRATFEGLSGLRAEAKIRTKPPSCHKSVTWRRFVCVCCRRLIPRFYSSCGREDILPQASCGSILPLILKRLGGLSAQALSLHIKYANSCHRADYREHRTQ